MAAKPTIDIVVPVFNEIGILSGTLAEILPFAREHGVRFIFSDDGSTDGGIDVVRRAQAEYPEAVAWVRDEANRGKGHALLKGFGACDADILGFIDADLEIPLSDLKKGIDRMIRGDEAILIGTKVAVVANRIRAYHRGLASFFYNGLVRLALRSHLPDHQCGLKLFRREVWRILGPNMRETGWAWDTEFLLRAQREGFSVGIFEVRLLRKRKSTVRFFSACIAMLSAAPRMRPRGPAL